MLGHGLELLKYFKLYNKNFCNLPLPDPGGSSSKTVNSSIEETSDEVTTIIVDSLLHSSHYPCMQ